MAGIGATSESGALPTSQVKWRRTKGSVKHLWAPEFCACLPQLLSEAKDLIHLFIL